MATSRGNRKNNYGFPQQGPPYNNPRPNQGGNSILPFMQHAGQPQQAPLIQQNPAMMGLPPHGATPFVPGNPHGGRGLPQIMYPPPTQLMGNRPSPFVHPNQFQQPQMAPNQYYPNPTPPPTIPPTSQIITNPAPPHTTGSKGSSSLVSYAQQSASSYHQPQQIQATSKKRSNAIAVINPDTREEVSVDDKNSSKASGSGLLNSVSNTSVSSSGSRSNVAVEFQSKVQGVWNPENLLLAVPKPINTIISVPGVSDTGNGTSSTIGTSGTGTAKSEVSESVSYSKSSEKKKVIIKRREFSKPEHKWVRDQVIPEDEQEAQKLFRKFQGILNKLTPQKFSDLAVKAQDLAIDTEVKLQGCIDMTYENVMKGPSFSIAYANLCRVLSTTKVAVNEDGNEVVRETTFRRELLSKCQREFEKEKKDDITREVHLKAIADAPTEEEKKKKQEEFDEWETIAHQRSLANIRFIGELFKLKMLSEGAIHDCILRLLRSTYDHESLECFCRLITTTGKELDHTQAKVRMDKYFERINEIIEKNRISLRIKFMLQDVQDLRKSDWVPRRQEGLKTIDQIHHEAKIEALQEQEIAKQTAAVETVKSCPKKNKKKGSKAVNVAKSADTLNEDTVRRKTCTILEECVANKNLQKAMDCITRLKPPGLLNVFVAESILFSLERSTHHREYAGNLLDCAFRKGLISKKQVHSGLKEVIDIVNDLELDIPKVWDFLGEILCPLFVHECLILTDYDKMIIHAGIGYKAPKALSRVLQQCACRESIGVATDVWVKSKLSWSSLGLEEDEREFLEREKLQFLQASCVTNRNKPPHCQTFKDPPYFKDLVILFGRVDTSNDDILDWIKNQKIQMDLVFIRSLSRASVESSVSEEGTNCILSGKKLRRRLPVVKKWVDENEEYQLEVLNEMQYSMNRLPPSMLSTVFWALLDAKVVSETACYNWRRIERKSGRGTALQTTEPFFNWLESPDQDTDDT